ncbi:MAG: hypothetical protein KDE46_30255, partial [Caldilineaceae bacterium]|nr:hypothetical protein [Caldilineaceae bacterium]
MLTLMHKLGPHRYTAQFAHYARSRKPDYLDSVFQPKSGLVKSKSDPWLTQGRQLAKGKTSAGAVGVTHSLREYGTIVANPNHGFSTRLGVQFPFIFLVAIFVSLFCLQLFPQTLSAQSAIDPRWQTLKQDDGLLSNDVLTILADE